MAIKDKAVELRKLAKTRKAARWPGYFQVEEFHDGKHECDFVSPYTKSAHNYDADLFLMLQDWSSEKELSGPEIPDQIKLGYTPSFPTNKNLIRLLADVFELELADTYATNLFPFVKPATVSKTLPAKDLIKAAIEFALPQVRIVKPKSVICFGLPTFQALRVAVGLKKSESAGEAMETPFCSEDAMFYYQAHPGGLGIANRGGFIQVKKDWENLRSRVGAIRGRIK
ncbi:MAG: hypothetical protein WDZ51_19005 [Pirellulaceae bacterium]